MFKKCTGTKTQPGCGELKMYDEFSIAYRSLCRECDSTARRNKYISVKKIRVEKKKHENDDEFFNKIARRIW